MKLALIFLPLACWANICIFTPPSTWQAVKPKELSEHVQIGFIGKGSTEFHPSINLAAEEVDCNLKEYVKAVKAIHKSQPGTTWRDLGTIEMKAGKGRLAEIVVKNAWGEVHMLQALFVSNGLAYILTSAVIKNDFMKLKNELIASMRSLQITDTLASAIQEKAVQEKFSSLFASLGQFSSEENKKAEQETQWNALQEFVTSQTESLGGYWQYLTLKEAHAKIFAAGTR